jgi:uncharacterized protein involved in exopolysaccharide biosynthesis
LKVSENKGLSVADYLSVLKESKRFILTFTLVALIGSIIIAFWVIKPVFLSTAVIKTASKSSGLGGLLGGAGLPDLGDFGDLASGGNSASELSLYENILTSRRCLDETITKFNLIEENEYKSKFDAYKDFRENILELTKDKVAGTLTIGIFDEDPARAKDIADFLVFQLNKINIELNVQSAKNNREYLENRLNLVKSDLKNAEDSLQIFQDRYGVSPDVTIQAAVKSQIELEAEIKSEELRLDLLKKIVSPDQPEIASQIEKINLLKKELSNIENSSDSESNLTLKGKPQIIINFLRVKREVEIQTKILTTILPLYEQAKIEEKKETPTVLILDAPQIPDKKSKPKRIVIILFGFFFGFILIYSYFLLKNLIIPKLKSNLNS